MTEAGDYPSLRHASDSVSNLKWIDYTWLTPMLMIPNKVIFCLNLVLLNFGLTKAKPPPQKRPLSTAVALIYRYKPPHQSGTHHVYIEDAGARNIWPF